MAFFGKNFLFDGIPSEMYNITISSISDSESSPVSNVELKTAKIFKRPQIYLLGVSQSPVLTFPIMLNTPEQLTAEDFNLVGKWLFGQQSFKKLQIVQNDMTNWYANVFFTNPQAIRVGNIIRGFTATMQADSPFFYTYPQTFNYNYGSPPSASIINFTNYSSDVYYNYPQIQFTMNGTGGTCSIVNTTDNDRAFTFTTLSPNETITVNNDLEIITSSLSILRLSHFNQNFFRLLPNKNVLEVTGNITNLKIIYQSSIKIG